MRFASPLGVVRLHCNSENSNISTTQFDSEINLIKLYCKSENSNISTTQFDSEINLIKLYRNSENSNVLFQQFNSILKPIFIENFHLQPFRNVFVSICTIYLLLFQSNYRIFFELQMEFFRC